MFYREFFDRFFSWTLHPLLRNIIGRDGEGGGGGTNNGYTTSESLHRNNTNGSMLNLEKKNLNELPYIFLRWDLQSFWAPTFPKTRMYIISIGKHCKYKNFTKFASYFVRKINCEMFLKIFKKWTLNVSWSPIFVLSVAVLVP